MGLLSLPSLVLLGSPSVAVCAVRADYAARCRGPLIAPTNVEVRFSIDNSLAAL